jgi:DNA-binding response OmpR family regulator
MPKVLIIDDDVDVRGLLRVTLAKLGQEVTLAARGEEGLQVAAAGDFDLIIVDLMMPDLDGYEVTRRLRADDKTKDVPILVLTARAQTADYDAAIEAGADSYLSKPYDSEILNRRVADLLKQSAERRSLAPAGANRSQVGRVTTVIGLRGGVGTTTCAVTLAGALLRAGRRVCLVDLSPSGGQVTLHLRLPAPTTWANLPETPDSTTVAQHLVRHESGLLVLAAPAQPARSGPPAKTFSLTLEALQIFFTDVIIDAAPTLDEATWEALGVSERVLVMCTPEVCAVHTAVGTLQALASVRRPECQAYTLLNHVSPDHNLPQAAVEKALGAPPGLVIPYDRQQPLALTHGAPLVFSQPGALLPTAVGAFALALTKQPA